MNERIGTDSGFQEAIGKSALGIQAVGASASAISQIGTASEFFALTPHAGAPQFTAFTHWGQTDIFFGGPEMDVPYGELD